MWEIKAAVKKKETRFTYHVAYYWHKSFSQYRALPQNYWPKKFYSSFVRHLNFSQDDLLCWTFWQVRNTELHFFFISSFFFYERVRIWNYVSNKPLDTLYCDQVAFLLTESWWLLWNRRILFRFNNNCKTKVWILARA